MNKNKNGFTLLELLVTLAIIGILAGALIPAAGTARELARGAACKSNLRQMIIAAHAYACANDDQMPASRFFTASGPITWEDILWEYDTRSGRGTDQRVQQCPSFKGSANSKTDGREDRYTGYNYNASYIGHDDAGPGDNRSAYLGDIKNPSNTAVFGDGQYDRGANKYMRSPKLGTLDSNANLAAAGTQGFRHRGATNVAFADASVRSLKERFADLANTSVRGAPQNNPVAKGCGFLSEDNSMYDLE